MPETARLLSKYQTSFTIVYALWDHEEVTTYGSTYYARAARSNADSILGVLNLDMLGWDGNSDGLMEIHGSTTGCSKQLADTVAAISRGYQLVLDPTVYIPGTASSDHAVFWRSGFTAILCTEAYWGGDFNPYYHSAGDRLGIFNSSFFHNLARLAAGSIAQLAGVEGSVGVRAQNLVPEVFALEQNYPNPFNPNTVVRYQLPVVSSVRLVVYDVLGREVAVLVNERKEAGVHEVKFSARGGSAFGGDGSNLASGVYVYRLTARHTDGGQVRPLDSAIGRDSKGGAGDFVQSKRLVLLK